MFGDSDGDISCWDEMKTSFSHKLTKYTKAYYICPGCTDFMDKATFHRF